MRVTALAVLLPLLAAPGPAPVPSGQQPPTLAALAFMAGCWRGSSDGGIVIEQYYTAPTDNLILGVSRYLKGGRVTNYEFSTIAREATTIVPTPRRSGQEPASFRLTRIDGSSAVWENPAHDFPTL